MNALRSAYDEHSVMIVKMWVNRYSSLPLRHLC